MLRFIALFLAIMLIANGPVCGAPLQRPTPHQGVEAGAKSGQQESSKDERGTNASPLIVKVVALPQDRTEAAKEEDRRKEQAVTEQKLAGYTLYLFFATVALAVVALMQAGLFVWQ